VTLVAARQITSTKLGYANYLRPSNRRCPTREPALKLDFAFGSFTVSLFSLSA
jgi:hypothetical protein